MIAVLTPYAGNELTFAACRVCEVLIASGREVKLIACGVREKNVDPFWDSRVHSDKNPKTFECLKDISTVVHFQAHNVWYLKTELLARFLQNNVKHVLVPNWHGIAGTNRDILQRFDNIICPTKLCRKMLKEWVFAKTKGVTRETLSFVHWDAGVRPIRRTTTTVLAGRIRVCFYCDAATVDFCGAMFLQLVTELLLIHFRLDITIVTAKSWCKADKKTLNSLVQQWGRRLTVKHVRNLTTLNSEFSQHDWVALPSVRGDFGLIASLALACGAAVLANDVAPFNEIISPSCGLLVPCGIKYGLSNAPIAIPLFARWIEMCDEAFSANSQVLRNLGVKDWAFDRIQTKFKATWEKVLES